MKYFVYILKCADGTLYTGITTDVERRFAQHARLKGGGYTQAHGAAKVVYQEPQKTRSDALKREYAIKSLTRTQKLELIGTFRN